MIGLLPDLPPNVAGFKASGEVTKEDYEKIVYPEIKRHTAVSRDLSFVFYVDTALRNFSAGAWIKDIWLGIKGLAMWHRVAIISDVEGIRVFTNTISHLLPGAYKGFPVDRLEDAIRWAATTESRTEAKSTLKSSPTATSNEIPAYIEQFLPAQIQGVSTMVTAEVTAGKDSDARFIYERAATKLPSIYQWTDHCGGLAAGFQLTDDTGDPLEGRAAVGDYIRIDIPGPGPIEGRGYDWVRIEKIEKHVIPAEGDAPGGSLSLLQVRPCADPKMKNEAVTAHFLEDSATSTFIIELSGRKVRASVFGRNEVPNTNVPLAADRVRNALVGSIGAIGLSKIQWKALVQGLLEKE